MFRVEPVIRIGPGTITGIDVIRFIPGLRFSSDRKEKLKGKNDEQETERSYLIRLAATSGRRIHVASELKWNESS